jgi:hypothetical protein
VQGDAAGIVAAVFEAFQTLDQDRGDVTLSNCADDTAHEKPRYKKLAIKRILWQGVRNMLSERAIFCYKISVTVKDEIFFHFTRNIYDEFHAE